MEKLGNMSAVELRERLQQLVADGLFDARERLLELLRDPGSAVYDESTVNRAAFETEPGALLRPIGGVPIPESPLATAFREFFCGYESVAFWLDEYEGDPLAGLASHTPLAKRLSRHRAYILARRTTTREERRYRRMGCYLPSDAKPAKAIAELSAAAFRALVRQLVMQELFSVREKVVELLGGVASREQLELAFREFFVAYELLELALEGYHYDPDDGFELNPEVEAEIDQAEADYKAGKIQGITMDELAAKLDW